MEKKNLIPYSVYLPVEHYKKLKAAAKKRKASELMREAVAVVLSGNDSYTAGYNQALKDAAKIVYDCKEAQMVAVNGKDVGALLSEQIKDLAK
jgi:hypothetical protein